MHRLNRIMENTALQKCRTFCERQRGRRVERLIFCKFPGISAAWRERVRTEGRRKGEMQGFSNIFFPSEQTFFVFFILCVFASTTTQPLSSLQNDHYSLGRGKEKKKKSPLSFSPPLRATTKKSPAPAGLQNNLQHRITRCGSVFPGRCTAFRRVAH